MKFMDAILDPPFYFLTYIFIFLISHLRKPIKLTFNESENDLYFDGSSWRKNLVVLGSSPAEGTMRFFPEYCLIAFPAG